jgi:polyhydroxybutyrate depolymerase
VRRWVWGGVAALGIVLGLLLVPGGGRGAPPTCRTLKPGLASFRVHTPDGWRDASVYVPHGVRGRVPLVLAFHGTGGSGLGMAGYSGLESVADREGFLVAYPSAKGDPDQWALGENSHGDDDLGLVDAIIDRLVAGDCADSARVYAVGVSNGGGFATRLGCERSNRIAAVVSVAGAYGPLAPCRPDRPVSLLEIHGTADQVVPYGSAAPGGVLAWVQAWAGRDGCRAAPRRSAPATRVVRLDYQACRSGTAVAHLAITDGRHQWPGASPPDPGPSATISAAEEAWRFLQGHRLAAR